MAETSLRAQLNSFVQVLRAIHDGWADPQQIVAQAVEFCRLVEEHAEFGRRTPSEDSQIELAGNWLLQRINSVPGASVWIQFAKRVGARTDEVERLEIGISGVLAAIGGGEEFDPRDITAMRSALGRLTETVLGEDSVSTSEGDEPRGKRSAETGAAPGQRRILVDVEADTVYIDDRAFGLNGSDSVKKRLAEFIESLVEADGDYVKLPDNLKTRNIENQPDQVRDLIEAQPGAGHKIPRGKIWRI